MTPAIKRTPCAHFRTFTFEQIKNFGESLDSNQKSALFKLELLRIRAQNNPLSTKKVYQKTKNDGILIFARFQFFRDFRNFNIFARTPKRKK